MTEHTETIFENTIRINSFDCDVNGNWKPASFFQYMTETAHLHAARLGAGYYDMIQRGLTWVHARMKLKFLRFPHIGEHIIIRTWPKTIQQKLFFIRDFELVDSAGQLLAQASSAWLIINTSSRRLLPPRALDLELPGLKNRHGLEEPLEKLDMSLDGKERLLTQAGYSSVDIVGHTNNSRYVEWICDAFPFDTHLHQNLDWIQVNYIHEVLPGDKVSIRARQLDNDGTWGVVGLNMMNQTTAFESLMQWKEFPPKE
jgi:acyl-ACP thioesterase